MSARETSPVIAVVQARMGSTRLPGKVMMEVCGKTILGHVVERLKSATRLDGLMVATTTDDSDDIIESWCASNGVDVYRGPVDDVLERYCGAALASGAATVVRITADCPLIDPAIVDEAIELFIETGCDYVGTEATYPDGLDTEVFSVRALKRARRDAKRSSEREHVTPYIWKNPRLFRIKRLKCQPDLSHMRWTVDDWRDFLFVSRVFESLHGEGRVFRTGEILKLLEDNPELAEINSGAVRNEGYAKSLKDDKAANF